MASARQMRTGTPLTTVKRNKIFTPVSLRLTENDKNSLEFMKEKIQNLMPNKNISSSGILRALIYLADEGSIKKIIESYKENV